MSNNVCGKEATFKYTWPGKDEDYICIEHAQKLMAIANAMGLYIQLIPIDLLINSDKVCSQNVSKPS